MSQVLCQKVSTAHESRMQLENEGLSLYDTAREDRCYGLCVEVIDAP